MITPIGQVNTLPKNTEITAIEGCITKIYPDVKVGPKYRFESVVFRGADGQECKVKFSGFEPLSPQWIGPSVRISGKLNIDEWEGKRTVMIPKGSNVEWNPQGYGAAPQGPPQGGYGGPPPSGPPAQSYGPYSSIAPPPPDAAQFPAPPAFQSAPPQHHQQQAPAPAKHWEPDVPRPPVFPGIKVGMAINNACIILSRKGVTDDELRGDGFFRRLHLVASDILRVSILLEESGELYKAPWDRAKATAAKQAKAQEQPRSDMGADHRASKPLPPAFPDGDGGDDYPPF